MKDALTAFLEGLIDYAGLFPPAQLELAEALHSYARYRREPDAWMLGRFLIAAARLPELAPYHAQLLATGRTAFRFSVLGGGGAVHQEAFRRLHADGELVCAFAERHGASVRVEALETPLPQDLLTETTPEKVVGYLRSVASILSSEGLEGLELFLEIPLNDQQPETVTTVIAGIAKFIRHGGAGALSRTLSHVGFKLRCGGTDAVAFPAPATVATVIATCRDHEVPLKCTAGLHHPLRHFADNLGTMSHGFLNVFGAGLLAHARKLPQELIEQCLNDEGPESFVFTQDSFSWREHRMTTSEIAQGRRRLMTSLGSCSFAEPRLDLRQLGLLM